MINAGFVDFLFTGVAIVPQLLLFTGYIGPALLLLIPLLIAACLVSMYRQQIAAAEEHAADAEATDEELPLSSAGR